MIFYPILVSEPDNQHDSLQPPTERDAPINPTFGYGEQFMRPPFLGTVEKLPTKVNTRRKHWKNGCDHYPTKEDHRVYEPRVRRGANRHFPSRSMDLIKTAI